MSEGGQQNEAQFNSLIAAIKNGSLERVEGILQNSPNDIVHRIEPQFRQPALYFAALVPGDKLSFQLIKLLIRNGANPNFKDHNEQSILFYICREGKQQCAELLLSHGLSLDDTDIYGQTPMFYAVSENRLEMVDRYATRERVNHVDNLSKQTPLFYAARKGHLEMAKLLVSKGADVTHLDSYNKNSAQYAKKAKFNELADYLNSQLKKVKDVSKSEQLDRKVSSSANNIRRKDQTIKDAKHCYKIVFMNEKGQQRELTDDEVKEILDNRPRLARYLNNPDQIPADSLTQFENDTWEKVALRILTHCAKIKGAYYFLQAVDPVKFNIMDYFDIITRPMDLGLVRKKLTHNCYQTPEQFIADVNLIWNNSYKYNGDGHVVSQCAKELQTAFNEQVERQGLKKYMEGEDKGKEGKIGHDNTVHQPERVEKIEKTQKQVKQANDNKYVQEDKEDKIVEEPKEDKHVETPKEATPAEQAGEKIVPEPEENKQDIDKNVQVPQEDKKPQTNEQKILSELPPDVHNQQEREKLAEHIRQQMRQQRDQVLAQEGEPLEERQKLLDSA